MLLSRIDISKVIKINTLTWLGASNHVQHVILLQDGTFLCTCFLHQNNGLVCRHFFHLMTMDKAYKYHISLVRKRWYKETLQDNTSLDISKEPFVFADTVADKLNINDLNPLPATYMTEIHSLFPAHLVAPKTNTTELSQKRRYGVLTGLSKQIAEKVSTDAVEYERIKGILVEQLADLRELEELKDPTYIKGKGRPKRSRLSSNAESKRGTKCGKCREEGHNSRTCKH